MHNLTGTSDQRLKHTCISTAFMLNKIYTCIVTYLGKGEDCFILAENKLQHFSVGTIYKPLIPWLRSHSAYILLSSNHYGPIISDSWCRATAVGKMSMALS